MTACSAVHSLSPSSVCVHAGLRAASSRKRCKHASAASMAHLALHVARGRAVQRLLDGAGLIVRARELLLSCLLAWLRHIVGSRDSRNSVFLPIGMLPPMRSPRAAAAAAPFSSPFCAAAAAPCSIRGKAHRASPAISSAPGTAKDHYYAPRRGASRAASSQGHALMSPSVALFAAPAYCPAYWPDCDMSAREAAPAASRAARGAGKCEPKPQGHNRKSWDKPHSAWTSPSRRQPTAAACCSSTCSASAAAVSSSSAGATGTHTTSSPNSSVASCEASSVGGMKCEPSRARASSRAAIVEQHTGSEGEPRQLAMWCHIC